MVFRRCEMTRRTLYVPKIRNLVFGHLRVRDVRGTKIAGEATYGGCGAIRRGRRCVPGTVVAGSIVRGAQARHLA